MMKDTFAQSPENWWGSISKFNWHCNRKPLHSDTSPEYTSDLAMGQAEADEVIDGCSAARSEVTSSENGSGLVGLLVSMIFPLLSSCSMGCYSVTGHQGQGQGQGRCR